jgi:hypothetical protein
VPAADQGLRFDAREVEAAVEGRDASSPIIRAALDQRLKKRRVTSSDQVHCAVSRRDKVNGQAHVNPPAGCGLVDESGAVVGRVPDAVSWPAPIDWGGALQPRSPLAPGDPEVRLEVFADTEWNETPHVFLERGARYHFAVVEGPDDWVDGEVTETNGADGYELPALKPFKPLARMPDAEWFALVGAVDRAELFRIGSDCEHRPCATASSGASPTTPGSSTATTADGACCRSAGSNRLARRALPAGRRAPDSLCPSSRFMAPRTAATRGRVGRIPRRRDRQESRAAWRVFGPRWATIDVRTTSGEAGTFRRARPDQGGAATA